MFSGIVEETGTVEQIHKRKIPITELTIRANVAVNGTAIGDSISVNGCCLTVVNIQKSKRPKAQRLLEFDLLNETWVPTNLQLMQAGSLVNLERSLTANGKLHGHFVTGHIDGMGLIKRSRSAARTAFSK